MALSSRRLKNRGSPLSSPENYRLDATSVYTVYLCNNKSYEDYYEEEKGTYFDREYAVKKAKLLDGIIRQAEKCDNCKFSECHSYETCNNDCDNCKEDIRKISASCSMADIRKPDDENPMMYCYNNMSGYNGYHVKIEERHVIGSFQKKGVK